MIATYKRKSNIAAAVVGVAVALAIVLSVNEGNTWVNSQEIAQFFALIGGSAFYYALWAYVKSKGRSGSWVLLVVFFFVFGLVILIFLKDKSNDFKTDLVDEKLI